MFTQVRPHFGRVWGVSETLLQHVGYIVYVGIETLQETPVGPISTSREI